MHCSLFLHRPIFRHVRVTKLLDVSLFKFQNVARTRHLLFDASFHAWSTIHTFPHDRHLIFLRRAWSASTTLAI